MGIKKKLIAGPIAVVGFLQLVACGSEAPEANIDDEAVPQKVAQAADAVTTSAVNDDSASPVHIQVKYCTTTTLASAHTVDCPLDAGYALIGGGGKALYTGYGALLTESRPLDSLTWRVSSHDHIVTDQHNLTGYAVGIRLDGVNSQVLRNMMGSFTVGVPNYNSISSAGILRMLSGGALAVGANRFLTASKPSWVATVKDHIVAAAGGVGVFTTYIELGTIEGFGALDIAQKTGLKTTVSTGVATATSSVDSGWAVAGYGGEALWTSGPGRLLFGMGPNGTNVRKVTAQSKDHSQASAGGATVYWTEARKVPNSHGLCNPGSALSPSTDTCVAKICAGDSYCCNTSWDEICVSEVQSSCNKSCADYTCSKPSYDAAFWSDPNVVGNNNCYNYANNEVKAHYSEPGRASGEWCRADSSTGSQCMTAANIVKYATNDGLIPSTASAVCPDNRTKVALFVQPGYPWPDYHWFRQDADGTWSCKWGPDAPMNTINGQPITNPENAGGGYLFVSYFCTCSTSTQGAGHAVID